MFNMDVFDIMNELSQHLEAIKDWIIAFNLPSKLRVVKIHKKLLKKSTNFHFEYIGNYVWIMGCNNND